MKRTRLFLAVCLSFAILGFAFSANVLAYDIFEAIDYDRVEELQAFIISGGDVNEKTDDDWTPMLYAAAVSENVDIITTLLKSGAEIHQDRHGLTPLMLAGWFNEYPDIVHALVEAGARIDTRYKDGWTPLMFAIRYNENPVVVQTFVELGASVNV
ncbi:MAG TPA: ankyrin repeat domain-containing protein, partial [Natronincola sp.]|nr:ankyrin repeat domain-containing protein [Natronincola sp.]